MYFHSYFHGVSGSFPSFLSHPKYTKDEINDAAYLGGPEVFLPFQKHYTESDSSFSRRGLWRRLRLQVSGSSLQILQKNPLPPSSAYRKRRFLWNAGNRTHHIPHNNNLHYIMDFFRHVLYVTTKHQAACHFVDLYLRVICTEGREMYSAGFQIRCRGLNTSN